MDADGLSHHRLEARQETDEGESRSAQPPARVCPALPPKIRFGVVPGGSSIRLNQCGACRRVFGGLEAFEKHRRNLACVDPATAGLRISRRKTFRTADGPLEFDVWSHPAPPMAFAAAGKRQEGPSAPEIDGE